MIEQERARAKGKPKAGPRSVNVSRAKENSGGQSASLDLDGKLIWD